MNSKEIHRKIIREENVRRRESFNNLIKDATDTKLNSTTVAAYGQSATHRKIVKKAKESETMGESLSHLM